MNLLNDNKLNIEKLSNTLVIGSVSSGKSVFTCKLIDYCIKNNYKIALADPKQVEYFKYSNYENLVSEIANNSQKMDNLGEFISKYDSKEKLYLFIDEYLEVIIQSKKLVKAINTKKDNIIVIACLQNPNKVDKIDLTIFNYEVVLRLENKLEGILETNFDTKNFEIGEFIIKDLNSKDESNKINNLEIK